MTSELEHRLKTPSHSCRSLKTKAPVDKCHKNTFFTSVKEVVTKEGVPTEANLLLYLLRQERRKPEASLLLFLCQ